MKRILFIFSLSFNLSADEINPPTHDHIVYMETVNYRLNMLYFSRRIMEELKLIRCLREYSDDCNPKDSTKEEDE